MTLISRLHKRGYRNIQISTDNYAILSGQKSLVEKLLNKPLSWDKYLKLIVTLKLSAEDLRFEIDE